MLATLLIRRPIHLARSQPDRNRLRKGFSLLEGPLWRHQRLVGMSPMPSLAIPLESFLGERVCVVGIWTWRFDPWINAQSYVEYNACVMQAHDHRHTLKPMKVKILPPLGLLTGELLALGLRGGLNSTFCDFRLASILRSVPPQVF